MFAELKKSYVNGLSKIILVLYGTAIVFGPPVIAQLAAETFSNRGANESFTKYIWIAGTIYVFTTCPFILTAIIRRWRSVISGIIDK